jgi:hypothetical protein
MRILAASTFHKPVIPFSLDYRCSEFHVVDGRSSFSPFRKQRSRRMPTEYSEDSRIYTLVGLFTETDQYAKEQSAH